MNDLLDAMLRDLGLEGVATIDRHEEALAPVVVGAAFAPSPGTDAAALPREVLADTSAWLARNGGSEAMLARVTSRPGTFLLDVTGFRVRGLDALSWSDEGLLVLDATQAPCSLLLERDATRLALQLGPAAINTARLAVDEAPLLELPARAAALSLPALAEVLGSLEVQPWITARYERAHAHDAGAFERAAAAGSVVRHAAPVDRAGSAPPNEHPLERAERRAEPARRILAWAATLDDAQRERLARIGCERAQGLEETLDPLVARIAAGPLLARDGAVGWLRSRDDLESVCVLLAEGSEPKLVLRDALDTLDHQAQLHATAWREIAPLDDPQLRAALADDPNLWWEKLS